MASTNYTIEVISTQAELSNLETDWNRLSETVECPNVFTTYDWFRAWTRRLVGENGSGRFEPHVLLLKRNNAVLGILPLVRRIPSRFGFSVRKLEFATIHADYNDLVLGGDPAGQTMAVVDLLAQTTEQWDIVDLRDLREDRDTVTRIKDTLVQAGLSFRILTERARYPYMPIDCPWSEMMKQHSRYTRRAFRKFREMNCEGLNVRIVENPQQEPGLLERLIDLEGQKHIKGELMPPFLSRYPEVFQSLFDTLGPRGWISVALLEWKDRLVAWNLLYRCGKKLWGYSTAFDHNFAHFSPGTILISAVVDYGFAHGFDEYDFLKGEEPYKMRWTTGFHHTYRLLIWNRRLVSRFSAFGYRKLRARMSASTRAERPIERPDISAAE